MIYAFRYCACLTALLAVSTPAHAQQEVRLKSGGVLVGSATIDGANAVVQVGDSALRVPMSDVAEITAVVKAEVPQPRRLLLTALEARLLNGADKEVVGILAEASRLSPDDPQIAFWYATSLVDAGFGKAANEALQAHWKSVTVAYPGAADRLASRIAQRLAVEKLPADVVQRLDQLAFDGRPRESGSSREQRLMFALFRVVDQHGVPLEISRQSIQVSANDEQLEGFSDGYYLFSFFQHSSSQSDPCQLRIQDVGVRQQEQQLRVAESVYAPLQEIKVHRFEENDKRPLVVDISDREGKPIKMARVTLTPQTSHGGTSNRELSFTANDEGEAKILVYPGSYQVRVERAGFVAAWKNVDIRSEQETERQKFKLYPQIRAVLTINWRWVSIQSGETLSGNAKSAVSDVAVTQQQFPFPIRFDQEENQLYIQAMGQNFGGRYGGPETRAPSIKQLIVDVPDDQQAGREKLQAAFDSLDLRKLDEAKDRLKELEFTQGRMGPRAGIEVGKIYVVTLQTFNQQRGQPGELTFKVWVGREGERSAERPAGDAVDRFGGF